jgi:pilus assembly protein CpaE
MMHNTIRTFVAVAPGLNGESVRPLMPGMPDVELVGLVNGLDQSWEVMQSTSADLILVATADSEDSLAFVRAAVAERPARPVVALCSGSPNGFVQRMFEAGADDMVTIPDGLDAAEATVVRSARERAVAADVLFAFQKALARRDSTATAADTTAARLVAVLGPKGGVGKTLMTSSLAVTLAAAGRRVVIVDLDLQFGDVGLALGLAPKKTIADLAQSAGSFDAGKVEDYLVVHESGARVLLAPTRPDQASLISVEFLRMLYPVLVESNDFVIVDTPPGFTPEVIATIDISSDVVMVGMLDSLSLKNTKLGLETLELMGYDLGQVRLVLNRADSRVGITREDVHAIVGRPPDVLIPSHRDIPRAVNSGTPLVLSDPRSDAAKAFRTLTSLYDAEAGRRNGRRRGLLRRKREQA